MTRAGRSAAGGRDGTSVEVLDDGLTPLREVVWGVPARPSARNAPLVAEPELVEPEREWRQPPRHRRSHDNEPSWEQRPRPRDDEVAWEREPAREREPSWEDEPRRDYRPLPERRSDRDDDQIWEDYDQEWDDEPYDDEPPGRREPQRRPAAPRRSRRMRIPEEKVARTVIIVGMVLAFLVGYFAGKNSTPDPEPSSSGAGVSTPGGLVGQGVTDPPSR